MKKPDDHKPEEGARFEVRLEKSRGFCGPEARPFEATLRLENGVAIWTTRHVEDVQLERVKALRAEGLSYREIEKETGIPKSRVERMAKRMETAA